MKRLAILAIMLWGSGICLAQDRGELQGFYLRIQGFDFDSGSPTFNIQNAHVDGGGYGMLKNFSSTIGMFQQMGFYGSVEQNGIKVSFFNELQGIQLHTKAAPVILYAKGGVGFAHYNVSGAISGGHYAFAANYGGGAELRLTKGLYLILEATRLTMSLPDLTGSPTREKWDHSWQLATGFAIHR